MLGRYINCNLVTERLYSVSISGLVTLDCNRFIGGMGGGRIGLAVFESGCLVGKLLVGINLVVSHSVSVECRLLLSVMVGRNTEVLSVLECV